MRRRHSFQVSLSPLLTACVATASHEKDRFLGIRLEGEISRVCKFRIIVTLTNVVTVHVGAPSGGQDSRTIAPM